MSVRSRLVTMVVLAWTLVGTLGWAPAAAASGPMAARTAAAAPIAPRTTPTVSPTRPKPFADPLPAPVSYWPGDGNADDVEGLNNGTSTGTYGPGVVNQAFHFDGVSQTFQAPDSPSLHPTVVSLAAWVRMDSLNTGGVADGSEYLVFKQNTGAGDFEGYTLIMENFADGSHHFEFVCSQPNDGQAIALSTTQPTTGAWYFLVGVYDGTNVRLYVDGNLEASVPSTGPLNIGTNPLYFGTSGESYFDGKLAGSLDEVRLYNVALTQGQIAQLYAADLGFPMGEGDPSAMLSLDLPSSGTGGDPVSTNTGNFTYRHTDLAIAGRGPSPVLERSYSSGDPRVGVLGPGWTFNYATRLTTPPGSTGNLALVLPDGATRVYSYNSSSGTYSPPPEVYSTLVHNPDGTYTVSQPDQTRWTFDAAGRLTAIADRYGNTSALSYNASGQLVSVSDPAGRGSLSFAYDATSGRLTSVADWLNPQRSVQYGYDGQYRLHTVTDRAGHVTTYGYQGTTSLLTTITDANQHAALTLTYDAQGRVQTQQDAMGVTTGQETTFGYASTSCGVGGTLQTTVTYPATSFDGFAPTTADCYNASNQLVQRQTTPSNPSGGDGTYTTTYAYDANSDLASVTDARGNTTSYCYDTGYNGQPTTPAYGNLTRTIGPPPAAGQNPLIALSRYDTATGQGTASVVDNLVETVSPKGVGNGATVTCATDLSASVNANYATDYAYDGTKVFLDSVTQRFTDPDKGPQTATTAYQYGDANNPGAVTAVIPPLGSAHTTTFTYYNGTSNPTEAGMLQQAKDALGDTTGYAYDPVGRRLTMTDPMQGVWSYQYDAEDRLTQTLTPPVNGSPLKTQYTYDPVGNRTVVVDASGQVTKYLYDARDSLAEVDQSPNAWTDPNATPSPLYRTTYSYDNLGNLGRIDRATGDSANERATDYQYDGLDRLRTEIQYPAWPATTPTLTTSYAYDQDNNRTKMVDAMAPAQTTTYAYDADNRLASITYSDGATHQATYAYDANGNRLSMGDGTGTTSYLYDELNRLTSVTQGDGQVIGYRYDTDGNRSEVIYPGAHVVTNAYDAADRLQTVTDWASRVSTYGYYADGQVHTLTNVDGSTATYTYDPAQRLAQVLNAKAGGAVLDQHA